MALTAISTYRGRRLCVQQPTGLMHAADRHYLLGSTLFYMSICATLLLSGILSANWKISNEECSVGYRCESAHDQRAGCQLMRTSAYLIIQGTGKTLKIEERNGIPISHFNLIRWYLTNGGNISGSVPFVVHSEQ